MVTKKEAFKCIEECRSTDNLYVEALAEKLNISNEKADKFLQTYLDEHPHFRISLGRDF